MGPLSIDAKRAKISWAYVGDKWIDKVKRMGDAQVHSVYLRLLNAGRLDGVPNYSAIKD